MPSVIVQKTSATGSWESMGTALENGQFDVTISIDQARAALAGKQWREAQTILEGLHADATVERTVYLLRARVKLELGEGDAAAGLFQELLALDPNNTEALISLARHHYRRQEWNAAYRLIQRYILHEPSQPAGHLVAARVSANLGMSEASIAAYESVRALDPGNVEAATSLANLYRKMGNPEAAIGVLEYLVGLGSDQSAHLLALALVQQNAKRPDDAEATLRKLLERVPGHRDATIYLARHLSRKRAHAEALALWQKLLEAEPEHVEFNVQIARIRDHDNRIEDAEPHLLRVLKRDPNHAEALRLLGRVCLASSRWTAARDIYERLLRLEPGAVETIVGGIRALAGLGELDSARSLAQAHVADTPDVRIMIELLAAEVRSKSDMARSVAQQIAVMKPDIERIARALLDIDLAPGHVFPEHKTWTDLARQLASEGRWRTADAVLAHAGKHGEATAATATLRGRALVSLKQWDEAENFWKDCLAKNPADPESLKHLVAIAREKGNAEDAIKLAGEWVRHAPESFEAASVSARLLGRAGRGQEAIAAWKRAIDLDENAIEAYMGLANACFNEGAIVDAAAAARRVILLAPDHSEALRLLARAAEIHGRESESLELWLRAAKANPAVSEPHVHLARRYRRAGQLKEAISAYRTVLEIDPNHAEALSALGRMYRETGEIELAEATWMRWMIKDSKAIEPLIFLARLSRERQQMSAALSFYRSILTIDGQNALASTEMNELLSNGR